MSEIYALILIGFNETLTFRLALFNNKKKIIDNKMPLVSIAAFLM